MTAHVLAEVALLEDDKVFRKKWESSRSSTLGPLPQTPQNNKMSSYRARPSMVGGLGEDSPQKDKNPRPKFNVNTLRRWFKEIDGDQSGSITRRELIVALRNHKELQTLLGQCGSAAQADTYRNPREAEPCPIDAQNTEMKRIVKILHQVDTDGSGSVEWDEFVEIFRRGGYLVEYKTRASLNDTSFKTDAVLEATEAHLKQLNLAKMGISQGELSSTVHDMLGS